MEDNIFDKVHEVDLEKTMKESYIDYAMSVITSSIRERYSSFFICSSSLHLLFILYGCLYVIIKPFGCICPTIHK